MVAFAALCLALPACGGGGGGGGGDFVGAANASVSVSPEQIDTADRMLVRVDVSDVNESGIALKIKFPVGLVYVPSSSSLLVDGKPLDISPDVYVAENNSRFLVFYLAEPSFGENKAGRVEFFLEGATRVLEGTLEVDADVDDPLTDNSVEFDPKNPDFAAEDSVQVRVEG